MQNFLFSENNCMDQLIRLQKTPKKTFIVSGQFVMIFSNHLGGGQNIPPKLVARQITAIFPGVHLKNWFRFNTDYSIKMYPSNPKKVSAPITSTSYHFQIIFYLSRSLLP